MAYERPRRLTFALGSGGRRPADRLRRVRLPPLGVGLARVWQSAYAALPASAFDRDAAIADALAAARRGCSRAHAARRVHLAVRRAGGALARGASAPRECRGAALSSRAARGARRCGLRGAAAFEAGLDPKRRKRWARQARRLAARGEVETTPAPTPSRRSSPSSAKAGRASAAPRSPTIPRGLASPAPRSLLSPRSARLDALALHARRRADRRRLVLMAGARALLLEVRPMTKLTPNLRPACS